MVSCNDGAKVSGEYASGNRVGVFYLFQYYLTLAFKFYENSIPTRQTRSSLAIDRPHSFVRRVGVLVITPVSWPKLPGSYPGSATFSTCILLGQGIYSLIFAQVNSDFDLNWTENEYQLRPGSKL